MTLQEALKAKRLLYLEPFCGFKPCRGLTGLYYYDTATESEKEQDIKVQIKTGLFPWDRKWVHLMMLKEIKDAKT